MRAVRTGLLVAWFVLIGSLFWDPLTPALTSPDNLASPFHLAVKEVVVQGTQLRQEPYAMGNRIFWTMILPLVPLFLMTFGHETWRRICPMSHFSQIPHMLGWQRQTRRLNRRTGQLESTLVLLPSDSWLGRNHIYFQFGFLTFGLVGRLLFYNSDRLALALLFLFMLSFALMIGLLYGGKTWCNYLCPIAVIQRIYTGPGGIFDSKAHIGPRSLAQSMCRATSLEGDRSNCVGCTTNCPDTDLENSYWKAVQSNQMRFMYYGFVGLVFAFYTYYCVYSGNWTYYMSGAWTHEPGQLATLLAPGFYFDGYAIPIPKVLAAPIYFAICIFGSYWFFRSIEKLYAWVRERSAKPLTVVRLRHQMLTVVAFLAINLFYLFAGRPNILLLPDWAIRLIDATIIFVSGVWLWTALSRDVDLYRHEQLAHSLRGQLARMGFRSEEVLEGRPLDSLSADEVYVLAKSLPGFTALQKREVYRCILVEVLEAGDSKSAESLQALKDLRTQLGLSDADHNALVEALGVQDPQLLDPNEMRSAEQRIRQNNYREYLASVVQKGAAAGVEPHIYLAREDVADSLRPLRTLYGISDETHERILSEITRDASSAIRACEKVIDAIRDIEINRYSLLDDPRSESRLLRQTLLQRQQRLVREAVNLIAPIKDVAAARQLAQSIYVLIGADAASAICESTRETRREVQEALTQMTADPVIYSYFDVVTGRRPSAAVFQALANDNDQIIAATALSALATVEPAKARKLAAAVETRHRTQTWLTRDILSAVAAGTRAPIVDTMAELLVVPTFAGLGLPEIGELARRAERRSLRRADVICQRGDVSDCMFVLLAGESQTYTEHKGQKRVLGASRAEAVFGELGVITGQRRSATIEVTSATATVMAIPGDVVQALLASDLHATRSILGVVSAYLLDALSNPRGEAEPAPAVAAANPAL
jgi:hypothetical protein